MKRSFIIMALASFVGLALVAFMGAQWGSIGPNPALQTAPLQVVPGAAVFTTGQSVLTGSGTTNLSQSPNVVTLTLTGGTATVSGLAVAGSYTYTANGSLNNNLPVYSGTNALALWNNGGTWAISTNGSVGGSTTGAITGGTAGTLFNVSSGSAVLSGGTLTGSFSTTVASSRVSIPCTTLTVSTTSSGCLVGSSSSSIPFPIPANVPVILPVANVNQVWLQNSGAASVGYHYEN